MFSVHEIECYSVITTEDQSFSAVVFVLKGCKHSTWVWPTALSNPRLLEEEIKALAVVQPMLVDPEPGFGQMKGHIFFQVINILYPKLLTV